ncbi:hypothetical protein FRB94_010085 [Tulasnella sp. JGI-2019a]|nr:hypothetical protein FRB94_010085 [Tulasnella sp. JGI-2019a]
MLFLEARYLESALGHADGKSEDKPIKLDVTISQMNSLMSVLLARQISSPLELTIHQCGEALGLATL